MKDTMQNDIHVTIGPGNPDAPVFHEESGSVRFWVVVGDRMLGASVGKLALHHRFRPNLQDENPLETFRINRAQIEAAVRRRYSEGALEPVMLREFDLRQ